MASAHILSYCRLFKISISPLSQLTALFLRTRCNIGSGERSTSGALVLGFGGKRSSSFLGERVLRGVEGRLGFGGERMIGGWDLERILGLGGDLETIFGLGGHMERMSGLEREKTPGFGGERVRETGFDGKVDDPWPPSIACKREQSKKHYMNFFMHMRPRSFDSFFFFSENDSG